MKRPPTNLTQAAALLGHYAEVDAQLAEVEASRKVALARINTEADAEVARLAAELDDLAKRLQPWWDANGSDHAGKRKSAQISGCTIGYRIGRPKLGHTFASDDKAVEALKENALVQADHPHSLFAGSHQHGQAAAAGGQGRPGPGRHGLPDRPGRDLLHRAGGTAQHAGCMKLGAFPMVERLAKARAGLVHQIERGRIGITIDGTYQEPDMVARLSPAIHADIRAQIAEIDEDLRQLGVELD